MKFQTGPPPITSDRLRPSSLHALKSALWLLTFCKVWRPPGHANPIFNNAACSTWPAYIKKTEGERQWNGTIPPLFHRPPETFNLADFQGYAQTPSFLSSFLPVDMADVLTTPFDVSALSWHYLIVPRAPISRTPFPPNFGRKIMRLGRIQLC